MLRIVFAVVIFLLCVVPVHADGYEYGLPTRNYPEFWVPIEITVYDGYSPDGWNVAAVTLESGIYYFGSNPPNRQVRAHERRHYDLMSATGEVKFMQKYRDRRWACNEERRAGGYTWHPACGGSVRGN